MSIPYGYIYLTKNTVNGELYIGQSTRLRYEDSYLGSGKHFLRAISKYGQESFEKKILSYCYSREELDFQEKGYISMLKPRYNIDLGGNNQGKLSLSTRARISEDHKRNPKVIAHMKQLREKNIGTRHTEEHKAKIRASTIGRLVSEETKLRMSNSKKGIKFSEEHIKNMGLSRLGKKHPDKEIPVIRSDGKIFESVSKAAISTTGKISSAGNISSCCRGNKLSAYGYSWVYSKEVNRV